MIEVRMKLMKTTLGFLVFFFLTSVVSSSHSIKGKVQADTNCREGKVMVWLGTENQNFKERQLLMHTEVPVGGTFEFYVKNGEYEVRATNEKGCGFIKK